jgi:hypothetical protein
MSRRSEDRTSDTYSEQETVRRADAALKRMFATPHQPHKPLRKKQKIKPRKKAD